MALIGDDHVGAGRNEPVKLFHFFVLHADTTRRHLLAEGLRIYRPVDTVTFEADAQPSGPQLIVRAAWRDDGAGFVPSGILEFVGDLERSNGSGVIGARGNRIGLQNILVPL